MGLTLVKTASRRAVPEIIPSNQLRCDPAHLRDGNTFQEGNDGVAAAEGEHAEDTSFLGHQVALDQAQGDTEPAKGRHTDLQKLPPQLG
jgi:hypothetical protein